MRLAELLGARPGLELGARAPDGVRGVEDVVLVLGPTQEVKLHEAFHFAEMAVAAEPDGLEVLGRILNDLEAIHRDKHGVLHSHIGFRP